MSIDMWIMIDRVKSENRGWFVLESPMVEELRKLCSQGLFKALEADECPVRFNYEGRIMAWPSGLEELTVKRILAEHSKEAKRVAAGG